MISNPRSFSTGLLLALLSASFLHAEPKVPQESRMIKAPKEQNPICDFQMSDEELRDKLTPEQYAITQQSATERPFANQYWDNHAEGIYVDVVSGEPLFSSTDKFDSGTGWPSFSKPIESQRVKQQSDLSHGMARTEVRSQKANSHLGHLFNDGPGPSGMRYCINSGSLRFVPKERLQEEGYGDFVGLFTKSPKKE